MGNNRPRGDPEIRRKELSPSRVGLPALRPSSSTRSPSRLSYRTHVPRLGRVFRSEFVVNRDQRAQESAVTAHRKRVSACDGDGLASERGEPRLRGEKLARPAERAASERVIRCVGG